MGRIVFGILFGMALAPAALLVWFHWGHPPVAVADPPLPMEEWITSVPLHARVDREMAKVSPIQADEGNLVAGARIYHDQCASCHGFHDKLSSFASHMFPEAPPLWEKHSSDNGVGVSDDPPGETYWKVCNGIRLSGMPAFQDILSETQMWQVSVLLANADKPLPPAALQMVRGAEPQAAPQHAADEK